MYTGSHARSRNAIWIQQISDRIKTSCIYLERMQVSGVVRQPGVQVTGHDVARAAGEGGIHRGREVGLTPFSSSFHHPVPPETSQDQATIHALMLAMKSARARAHTQTQTHTMSVHGKRSSI